MIFDLCRYKINLTFNLDAICLKGTLITYLFQLVYLNLASLKAQLHLGKFFNLK